MENTQTMILIPKEDWDNLNRKVDTLMAMVKKRNYDELMEEWIDSEDARKILAVSRKTWQTYRDNRIIPFSQFGRKIYVKRGDLEKYMLSHRISG